jgi:stage II sporulation protein P
MKRLTAILIVALMLMPVCVRAEEPEYSDDLVYRINDEAGAYLTSHAGRVYQDDEYIAEDNKLYIVTAVDDSMLTATASYVGMETAAERVETQSVFGDAAAATNAPGASPGTTAAANASPKASGGGKKLVAMYSTHDDESYEPSDGTSSKTKGGGILDVGDTLKQNLEKLGIDVVYDKSSHLPHDAGAYRRSRQTAEELLKKQPEALIDVHRDGIPDPKEYDKTIDGEKASKVRLEVGRSNPNADANRNFAKEIKATADKKYPGLIKDIFIGKGNYNQELYPQSVLLEFGTVSTDKDRAKQSTEYMANVLDDVLFGGSAKAETNVQQGNKSAGKGVLWLIGGVIVAGVIYALAATGTFDGMKRRLARGTSEVTGGSVGRKPKEPNDPK